MPCRDYDDDVRVRTEYVTSPKMKRKLDKVTRLLCGLCKAVEIGNPATLEANPELKDWWGEHKEQDRKREAAENAEKERIRLKEQALNKLTPEEKKLLGLKEN